MDNFTTTARGKLIAVIGTIGSGKSTLVRELNARYEVRTFLEGEAGDFADFVKANLATDTNRLQTQLYFMNQAVRHYMAALEHVRRGEDVVLDTFWLCNHFFVKATFTDPDEARLLDDMLGWIERILPQPDVTVVLEASDELLARRIRERSRSFESEAVPRSHQVAAAYRTYFADAARLEKHHAIIVDSASADADALGKSFGLKARAAQPSVEVARG